MELCCTYIETDKFNEVVDFYEKIFETKGTVYTENRWVEFDFGNKLSIYNRIYDLNKIEQGSIGENYNEAYIKSFHLKREKPFNNRLLA